MGISIHFTGKIDPAQISPLCEELKDIAQSAGFMDSVVDTENPEELTAFIERIAEDFQKRRK